MYAFRFSCLSTALIACLMVGLSGEYASAYWGPQCGQECKSQSIVGDAFHHMKSGYITNNMWPYPHVCPDRVRAHAPFEIMVNNGWRRQNLLGPHHFHSETGKLTRAGELKIEWILTQTPPSRRQVFVERSINSSVTEDRLAQVQEFASGIQTEGEMVAVLDTHVRSPKRAASMVDAERNSFIESRPPAVLPAANTNTSSSGS